MKLQFDKEPMELCPPSYDNALTINHKKVRIDIDPGFKSITLIPQENGVFKIDFDDVVYRANNILTFRNIESVHHLYAHNNQYYHQPDYHYTYIPKEIFCRLIEVLINRSL